MKKIDSRHKKRISIVQELYSIEFNKTTKLNKKSQLIFDLIEKIDPYIKKYAIKFPLEKIAKIDLAILRLAIFELLFEKKEPVKVIIDEAVELGKELGSEKSYAFINGILGKIYESELK